MRKIAILFCRRAALLCLAAAVMNLHLATVLGAPSGASVPPAGELIVTGQVMVNGAPGITGQTCFSGSTFAVAARSRSTLALRNRARVELSAETTLKLDFSDATITGTLGGGRLRVSVPSGVAARFTAADAAVRSDPGQPALFSIQFEQDGGPTVSVELGQVEVSAGKRTQVVNAGQFFSISAGAQPLPAPRQSFSKGKKIGLGAGLGLLGAMLALIFTDDHDFGFDRGGCVITFSPTNEPPPPCEEEFFSLP